VSERSAGAGLDPLLAGEHARVARNTALSLVAIGLLGASRLAYNVIVGRRFGAVALGRANIAINTALFASLLVSGGWGAACAKYLAQSIGRDLPGQAAAIYRRALRANLLGGAVIAGGMVAVLPHVIRGFTLRGRDLALAALVMFTYNAYTHLKGAYYGLGRVSTYVWNEIASDALLLAALGVVVAAGERGLVLLPMAVSYGFFSVAAAVHLRHAAGTAATIEPWQRREISGFVVLAVIGTVASTGFLNISVTFAGRYASATAVGHFSAALALVIPVYFFPRALSLALFPSVAYRFGQQRVDSVSRQLEISTRGLIVLLLPPTAAVALLARFVLRTIYGGSYEAGASVLAVLLAATYLSVVPIPSVTSLSGTERRYVKVPVWSSVLGLAIGLALWVTLGPRYGAPGIAWGYLFGSVPQTAIPMWFAARAFGVRLGSLAMRAAVVWAAVLGLWLWLDRPDRQAGLGASLVAVGIVGIVYLALFGRDVLRILGDLRQRVGRGRKT
jgi:putative peptidoglycan lipid II flippase